MRAIVVAMTLMGCAGLMGETTAPPPEEAAEEAPEAVTPAAEGTAAEAEASEAPSIARLNLNDATEEQLKAVPGITPKMVHEFEEYRPWVSVAQFRKEIGKYVDEQTVRMYEKYVYVPVDPDKSDALTLQQLGLTEAQANALMAERPFADRAAFEAMLAEHLSDEAVESAKSMLTAP